MVPPSSSPPTSSESPPEPTNSFIPRPFPPPSLAGIPLEYVINSLRRLAPQYWNNAESADCSIIYPLNNQPLDLSTVVDDSSASRIPRSEVLSNSHDPSSMGRRLTAPSLNRQDVRMLMKLHIDYLSAQSTLLRALFSGASPLDLIHPASQPSPSAAGRISISASVAARLPRLLPSSSDHPIVYLPIPDPSSFPYLVSWMYFGDTTALDNALQRRAIHWDGLARNVEYLGMPEELKRFLGRWYRRWLQSVQSRDTKDDENDETPRGRSSSREHSTSPH